MTLKEGQNSLEIKAVNKNTAVIYGYITYNDYDLTVTINGQNVSYDSDKVFNITVNLVEGDNQFEIIAINKYGKEHSAVITIKYVPAEEVTEPAPTQP